MATPQSNAIELRPIQYNYPPTQPNVTYAHTNPPYVVSTQTQPPPYYVSQQYPNYYPPNSPPININNGYSQPLPTTPVVTPLPMIMTTAASIPITNIKPKSYFCIDIGTPTTPPYWDKASKGNAFDCCCRWFCCLLMLPGMTMCSASSLFFILPMSILAICMRSARKAIKWAFNRCTCMPCNGCYWCSGIDLVEDCNCNTGDTSGCSCYFPGQSGHDNYICCGWDCAADCNCNCTHCFDAECHGCDNCGNCDGGNCDCGNCDCGNCDCNCNC